MNRFFDNSVMKIPAWFYIWSTVWGLCAALMAVPAAARTSSSVETSAAALSGRMVLQEVAAMGLYIISDGNARIRVYSAQELARTRLLEVDGYVNGAVLLGKRPLAATVDGCPMNAIRKGADGIYQLKHMGRLSSKEFWSTFFPAGADPSGPVSADSVRSYYSCFPTVPGYSLSDRQEFSIAIQHPGGAFELKVRQRASRRLDPLETSSSDRGFPELYCLGGDASRFDPASKEYRERLNAVLAGIRRIEAITRQPLVKRVHFIEYNGSHNAYTVDGESDIWIYNPVFWSQSVAELQVMAQHEALHVLADQLDLPDNSRMREFFSDLSGFDTFSLERFTVMTTGHPPDVSQMAPSPGGVLFDFINEKNFIPGMQGGHAQDNVAEFCASFLHTLVYVESMPSSLIEAVIMRDGSTLTLSADQRQRVLDGYQKVLSIIAEELPESTPGPLSVFFNATLETVSRISLTPPGTLLRAVADPAARATDKSAIIGTIYAAAPD